APWIETEHTQRPVRHRRDAADHAHRRALACTVRAEEAERLALADVEVDRVDGAQRAEALRQTACMDERAIVRHAPTLHTGGGPLQRFRDLLQLVLVGEDELDAARGHPRVEAGDALHRLANAGGERGIDGSRAHARLLLRAGPLRALLR